MNVAVGARTDTGRVRDNNEDSMFVSEPLFAVADGMGGHLAGDVASATAIEIIQQRSAERAPSEPGALASYVEEANSAIFTKADSDPDLSGMGTTCTLLYLEGDTAHIAHVGDSRAYLLRGGGLRQITNDHTLVERMVQEGRIGRDEAHKHPQRSIITRALGVEPHVEVDTFNLDLEEGDRVLLCSDGLSSMMSDEEIARILRDTPDVQQAADRLVEAANAAGGDDNITVVLLVLGGGGGPAAPVAPAPPREDTVPSSGRDTPMPASARTWPKKLIIGLVLVAVLIGGGYALARYSLDNSYFVGVNDDGLVTVYRGIPEEIAGLSLRDEQEVTDITLEDLPESLRDNLEAGIKVSSLDEAHDTVRNLEDRSREFGAGETRTESKKRKAGG